MAVMLRGYYAISSMRTGLTLLLLIAFVSAVGSAVSPDVFFDTFVFRSLLLLLLLNMILCTINRLVWFKSGFLKAKSNRGLSKQIGILLLHAGVVLILAGGTVYSIYGQSTMIDIASGDTVELSSILKMDEPFALRLDNFEMELNEDGSPSQYYSHIKIVEGGKEVEKQSISVNYPMEYKGIKAYQQSFGYMVRVKPVSPGKNEAEVCLKEGESLKLPGTERVVKIYRYFPDFNPARGMEQQSIKAGNPRIVYSVYENEKLLGVGAAKFGSQIKIDEDSSVLFKGAEPYTVLKIKSDPGLPVVLIGALLFMMGVSMALFFAPVNKKTGPNAESDQIEQGYKIPRVCRS